MALGKEIVGASWETGLGDDENGRLKIITAASPAKIQINMISFFTFICDPPDDAAARERPRGKADAALREGDRADINAVERIAGKAHSA